ncbi:MAG TPA: cyclic nucleotide-binding domain-containing protein [Vicinamibacteria bacterium]|nr:cyclic nucleotide-binding domain-containing protein [Vicinamibacteria bacterium]
MIRAVLAQGQLLEFGPGDVLFRQGAQGDRLYVVKSGVLEVVAVPGEGGEARPVAYLGSGEVIGELALLTGSPRTATVRSPEHAVAFAIEKAVFLDLMDVMPAFSRNLCVVLARRLERTTLKIPPSVSKQLQGALRYFDLATVMQTLVGSQQTGALVVRSSGRKLAELSFVSGEVVRAKHGHLVGEDAVYQLFQSPVEGEFSFAGCAAEQPPSPPEIALPAISLLMESVRLQDELSVLRERLPDPRQVFRQQVPHLSWDDPETLELAAAVWSRLRRGGTLEELQREVPRCSHAIYRTVAALLESGQVE